MRASCKTIIQHHNQNIDISTVKVKNISITRISHVALLHPHWFPYHPRLNPRNCNLSCVSVTVSFKECYIIGIISYVTFCDCPFSLSIILWKSTQRVVEYYFMVCMQHECFNHSPLKEYLGCFQFELLQKKKLLLSFVYRFCVNRSSFLWENSQVCNWCVI